MPNDLWTFRAPIEIRQVDDQPKSKAALLARVRELAPDPTVFDTVEPFLWRTIISTNALDSYGTMMMPSTLRNFADDASRGVPVLESHNSYNLPIGRSLTGVYKGPQGTGQAKVTSDAYMIPGLSNGRVSTDDMIHGIKAGIYSDASVGFRGGEILCSICNTPMFGRGVTCMHWPGETYTDDSGANPQVAIGRVENANLGEYSMVYDGATPGAMVDKIHRQVEAGMMRYEDFQRLQARYGYRLDPPYRVITSNQTNDLAGMVIGGDTVLADRWFRAPIDIPNANGTYDLQLANDGTADNPRWVLKRREMEQPAPETEMPADPEGGDMGDEQAQAIQVQLEAHTESVRSALRAVGAPDDADVRWFEQEISRLRPLADDGRAYRADLVEQTIESGVRAYGTDFAVETYRGMLGSMTLDQIKTLRSDFETLAAKILPAGRQTTDGQSPEQTEESPRRRASAAAYRS